jgi:hypothetical protein
VNNCLEFDVPASSLERAERSWEGEQLIYHRIDQQICASFRSRDDFIFDDREDESMVERTIIDHHMQTPLRKNRRFHGREDFRDGVLRAVFSVHACRRVAGYGDDEVGPSRVEVWWEQGAGAVVEVEDGHCGIYQQV